MSKTKDDAKKTETKIPNGILPNPTNLSELIKQWFGFAKGSAENTIRMCGVLVQADRLSEPDRTNFCKAVKLEYSTDSGSKYYKLLKIGEKASRFDPYLDKLPNAWTTQYKLATLEEDDFKRVIADERFAPTMTAGELDEILNPGSGDSQKPRIDLNISFNDDVEKMKQLEAGRELRRLGAKFGFTVKPTEKYKKELLPPKKKDPSYDELLDEMAAAT